MARQQHMILSGCLFLLLFFATFDPADKILGLKLPAFILCWLVFLFFYVLKPVKVARAVYVYIFLMLFIPILSMLYFHVFLGGGKSAAFILIKAQLFVSLIYILVAARIDIIPMLSRILSLLACTIIGVKALILLSPELLPVIQIFGSAYGILLLGDRSFADSASFQQIYFVTSPMLVIAIAYYSDKACRVGFFSKYTFLTLLTTLGMIFAGTRSNMIGPFLVLIIVVFYNTKNKTLFLSIVICALILFLATFYNTIIEVLSFEEKSNSSKLILFQDYVNIFTDPVNLIFGQGFGSYYDWGIRGNYFISELSYLELIRVYGLFLGACVAVLILYPLLFVMFSRREFSNKASIAGFTVYMAIAALNPLIFSSLGMTIISAFVANIFRSREFNDVYISDTLGQSKVIGSS